MIRLDKYLSEANQGSRSQLKGLIRKGHVSVDGEVVKAPDAKISEQASVCVDGVLITYQKFCYLMLHKPAGVVSATEDSHDKTVLDLIRPLPAKDLFPVGRLDKDTEGLLLITNDGQLSHNLLSPRKHVDKVYFVRVEGELKEADRERFAHGLEIGDDKPTKPAGLEILQTGAYSEARVTIHEGRFHQVKRMFQAVGTKVVYLKRLSMGSLKLDPSLEPGAYRMLQDDELDALLHS